MSRAQLFADAIHNANTAAHNLFWGLIFAAALCVLVVPTVIGGLAWGVDALREALSGSVSAETPVPVPEPPRKRPVPHWARTQPLGDGYDEAA